MVNGVAGCWDACGTESRGHLLVGQEHSRSGRKPLDVEQATAESVEVVAQSY